jgi:alanine-synthesizing transaminase
LALDYIKPAKRTENIRYAIRDIIVLADEVAKTGKKMYYLNIGDPNVYDFVTPPKLVEVVHKAMLDNKNGYSPSSGIPIAIDAIKQDAKMKGISNIIDVFVTTGAAEAIEVSLTALLNAGDNFLMPTPGYPLYTAIQAKLECEPNPYYLDEENGWQPDVEDIRNKINNKTKAIVLINPNNPTGSIASRKILEEIVEIAVQNNLVIIADEIYDKLIFDGKEMISIASLNPDANCITFSGLSKNFMAPGWRIGWGIVTGKLEFMKDYVEAINKILRSRVSANHPLQYAIPEALLGDKTHIQKAIKTLETRSNLIADKISKIDGIDLVKPEGAFYAFPKIEVQDDWDFCKKLLAETGVIVVPGDGFGQKPNTKHFRIVICPTEDVLSASFDLIGEFYKTYKGI